MESRAGKGEKLMKEFRKTLWITVLMVVIGFVGLLWGHVLAFLLAGRPLGEATLPEAAAFGALGISVSLASEQIWKWWKSEQ
ncbi:hypothetical protein A2V80_01810 [Candidatus Woesebacteria bacterium RBG_16_39_8b]|uniref:Uncharacterized protein n=1 Tax=Candidatus Woesebacteria bacterium RBG_16_39_8b TaxID=1802482 RepID=A0A1F7XCI9_9BACT|nr:MAG: hypothetical protein A2V80_01810 [Candidatus Woesebacteria bacterium RBG_16_39_8b]